MSDRLQHVKFKNKISSNALCKYGVPQGSVFGPLLFLIFINDIQNATDDAKIIMFADDTTVIEGGKNYEELIESVDRYDTNIKEWFLSNNLSVNTDKCMSLLFTLRQDLTIDSEEDESVKFLGVIVDNRLIWDKHAGFVANKLAKVVYFLRILRESLSPKYLRVAYFAFFHSVMTYAVFNWGHSSHSSKVFALQRRCIRVLHGVGYRDDCRNCFRDLNVLTLPSVYILHCLMYAKKNSESFVRSESIHSYGTRANQQYRQPFLRLQRSRNGSNYWAVKFYNVVPDSIKCYSYYKFQAVMKKYLVKNCIYNFDEFLNGDFSVEDV